MVEGWGRKVKFTFSRIEFREVKQSDLPVFDRYSSRMGSWEK
jgi:ribosomal protein S14